VLVTGATGYIGGRLVPRLLAEGHVVRAMTRDAGRLRDVPWADQVEVVEADALGGPALDRALAGVDVAYYLVHSIGAGRAFERTDREAAAAFAAAARAAGVGRLVYLGGLVPSQGRLSPHLASAREVGQVLLDSGVPTVVLQAAVILGSGSASFEMLRYLTERLPAMITPKWVDNRIQPIAVRDVLRYLVGAATLPAEVSRRFDIGGPEVLTYREMMQRYAAVAGLRRRVIVPVPLLTPRLSGTGSTSSRPCRRRWPSRSCARWCTRSCAARTTSRPTCPTRPRGCSGSTTPCAWRSSASGKRPSRRGGRRPPGRARRPTRCPATPRGRGLAVRGPAPAARRRAAAGPVAGLEGIGGEHGWYSFPLAWAVRGLLDRLVGGVGLRRGRRDPDRLWIGESLDFWRVEEIDEPSLLRLRAEMRLPGAAWLELRVEPGADGRSTYVQRALFHPRGLAGHAYWWAVAPFHRIVFGGMLAGVARPPSAGGPEAAST
jgi:uncharacterized protein YbjT (DUF2867 family)